MLLSITPFRHSAIPPFRHSAIPPFLQVDCNMSIVCKVLKLTINSPAVTPFLGTHVQHIRKGKASHLLTVHEARTQNCTGWGERRNGGMGEINSGNSWSGGNGWDGACSHSITIPPFRDSAILLAFRPPFRHSAILLPFRHSVILPFFSLIT